MLNRHNINLVIETQREAQKVADQIRASGVLTRVQQQLNVALQQRKAVQDAFSTLSQVSTLKLQEIARASTAIDRQLRAFQSFQALNAPVLPLKRIIEDIPSKLPQPECEECAENAVRIENLERQLHELKWFLLGFGREYPPKNYDSFDDFTELSKN